MVEFTPTGDHEVLRGAGESNLLTVDTSLQKQLLSAATARFIKADAVSSKRLALGSILGERRKPTTE